MLHCGAGDWKRETRDFNIPRSLSCIAAATLCRVGNLIQSILDVIMDDQFIPDVLSLGESTVLS